MNPVLLEAIQLSIASARSRPALRALAEQLVATGLGMLMADLDAEGLTRPVALERLSIVCGQLARKISVHRPRPLDG